MRNLINTISAKPPVIHGSIEEQRDPMAGVGALDRNFNLHAVLEELFPTLKKVVSGVTRAAALDMPGSGPGRDGNADSAA
jgi:hypothetical protein